MLDARTENATDGLSAVYTDADHKITGEACIGIRCLSAQSVRRSRLSWTGLIEVHANATRDCAIRDGALVYGCPYHRCAVVRPNFCKALGRAPTTSCPPQGSKKSYVTPCHTVNQSERHYRFHGDRRAKPRTCTGSMGEESFVLRPFFGGASSGAGGDQPLRGGVFLELGAADGFQESNTLHLEHCLGWRGLLVEGAPRQAEQIGMHRPQALTLRTAICPTHGTARFAQDGTYGRLRGGANSTTVPCGPLGDWLSLLQLVHIDVMFLDVQGSELAVLRTLHWQRQRVGVLVAECQGRGCTSPKDASLVHFLRAHCMAWIGILRARHDVWDHMFANVSLLLKLPEGWDGSFMPYDDRPGHSWASSAHSGLNRTQVLDRLPSACKIE